MRIAVAYQDGMIYEHFGHAGLFAVYDYQDADVNRCTKQLVETGERHGHQAMAELMRDLRIDAVIAGNMGGEAKASLLRGRRRRLRQLRRVQRLRAGRLRPGLQLRPGLRLLIGKHKKLCTEFFRYRVFYRF